MNKVREEMLFYTLTYYHRVAQSVKRDSATKQEVTHQLTPKHPRQKIKTKESCFAVILWAMWYFCFYLPDLWCEVEVIFRCGNFLIKVASRGLQSSFLNRIGLAFIRYDSFSVVIKWLKCCCWKLLNVVDVSLERKAFYRCEV